MEFDALYARYADRLLGWAVQRTQAPADAEDLIQDAFLAIHLSLPRYRGESELDAFVFGVARNVWRTGARARARMKRAAPRVALHDIEPRELVDPRTPLEALHGDRMLRQVEARGREQLGEAGWAALLDYAFDLTDLDALERETGLSRDALKSRISRRRRRLFEACPELAT
jgi:RNA polymerase sigma-70 factor, ECF subfamily